MGERKVLIPVSEDFVKSITNMFYPSGSEAMVDLDQVLQFAGNMVEQIGNATVGFLKEALATNGNYKTETIVSMKQQVTDILQGMQIPKHIKGFKYLRTAVLMCVENPALMNNITKGLYVAVAEYYKEVYETTPSKVERCIRNAIELGEKHSKDKRNRTNSEVIADIVDSFLVAKMD